MPNLRPIAGSSAYSLEVAPELRRQAVGRPSPEKSPAPGQIQHFKHSGEKLPENFIHSLAFIEPEKAMRPQQFKQGIPLVQRLHLDW